MDCAHPLVEELHELEQPHLVPESAQVQVLAMPRLEQPLVHAAQQPNGLQQAGSLLLAPVMTSRVLLGREVE